eukprot:4721290-Lingulodinium_polyedra.AAC.1
MSANIAGTKSRMVRSSSRTRGHNAKVSPSCRSSCWKRWKGMASRGLRRMAPQTHTPTTAAS